MAHRAKEIVPRLGRLLNYQVSVNKDDLSSKFIIPGFKYADFDRAGRVNMYTLNMTLETGRLLNFSNTRVFGDRDESTNTLMVMFSQRFDVSPNLHSKACLDFPMMMEGKFIAMGRSSLISETSLTEQSTGERMVTSLQKLVNMDKTTKRSAPLTPKIVEKFDKFVEHEAEDVFEDISPPNPSPKMFSTERKVYHSDMDFIFHTNQGSYTKFALDCASEAIKAGSLTAFEDDICFYNAKRAGTVHFRESFAGDLLGIHVWEDEKNPRLLHFVASQGEFKRSSIVYYSFIDFSEADSPGNGVKS